MSEPIMNQLRIIPKKENVQPEKPLLVPWGIIEVQSHDDLRLVPTLMPEGSIVEIKGGTILSAQLGKRADPKEDK